jgi:hypothetical protein
MVGTPRVPQLHPIPVRHPTQIWSLEKDGGSLVGGSIQLLQERKKNPPPPRDPKLPPKPQGQTVGSFRKGLKQLVEGIEANVKDAVRWGAGVGRRGWGEAGNGCSELGSGGGMWKLGDRPAHPPPLSLGALGAPAG